MTLSHCTLRVCLGSAGAWGQRGLGDWGQRVRVPGCGRVPLGTGGGVPSPRCGGAAGGGGEGGKAAVYGMAATLPAGPLDEMLQCYNDVIYKL